MTQSIDFKSIQGNTFRGYGMTHPLGHHFLLRVARAARARATVAALLPSVTSDADWRPIRPHATLNVAFTFGGLVRLGISRDIQQRFAPEFRSGMLARATYLGDDLAPAPVEAHWSADGGVDALVTVNMSDESGLAERVKDLRARLEEGGYAILAEQPAGFPQEADSDGNQAYVPREHFGWLDGRGQPDVDGVPVPSHRQAQQLGISVGDGWRALKPGEFVFGYEKESGAIDAPGERAPAATYRDMGQVAEFQRYYSFMENGTYLVYRKLRQRVATFRLFLREHRGNLEEEFFGAKLVGRWRDATPLMLAPTHDEWEAHWKGDEARAIEMNRFAYGDDKDGLVVPLGAHVRRANPRDSLPGDASHARRRRIIRRGIPYGAPQVPFDVATDVLESLRSREFSPEEERGLIFMSVQTDITGQFEVIQRDWLNDGNIFEQGADRCPVVGNQGDPALNMGTMYMHGHTPPIVTRIPTFVELRGGDYFFKPGIQTLARIGASDPTIIDIERDTDVRRS